MIEQAGAGAHCSVDPSRIDFAALNAVTYGLYVVTARDGERRNGCVINTLVQVALTPCQVSVSINKANLTHELIMKTGRFAVAVLERDTPMTFIGAFGFRSGRDADKFAAVRYRDGLTGCPLPADYTLAVIEANVRTAVDCGSHTTFIADVVASETVQPGVPLTYAYYHEVKGGKTGKNAPTYAATQAAEKAQPKERKETVKKHVCQVCGYVYDPAAGDPDNGVPAGTDFEQLPADWVCPVCGAGQDQFEPEA